MAVSWSTPWWTSCTPALMRWRPAWRPPRESWQSPSLVPWFCNSKAAATCKWYVHSFQYRYNISTYIYIYYIYIYMAWYGKKLIDVWLMFEHFWTVQDMVWFVALILFCLTCFFESQWVLKDHEGSCFSVLTLCLKEHHFYRRFIEEMVCFVVCPMVF